MRKSLTVTLFALTLLAPPIGSAFAAGGDATIAVPDKISKLRHPAGTNGSCKDGSFSTEDDQAGACRGHGGVTNWWNSARARRKLHSHN